MKRNIIKVLFLILLSCVTLSVAIACTPSENGSGDNGSAELVLTDQTIDVTYGGIYKINTIVKDSKGNIYDMSYQVKDSQGNKIDVTGDKFSIVEKSGYVIDFTLTVDGTTYTKKDTLNVLANGKPAVSILGNEQAIYFGDSYTVPTAVAVDAYDGDISTTIEIYKKTIDGQTKCDYDGSGVFTPSESGEYFVRASATNSGNTTNSADLPFYVRAQMQAGEFDNFDDESCVLQYENKKLFNVISQTTYEDNFYGKTGVLRLALTLTQNNTSDLHFYAKGNKADYASYDYIAVTAYVEGKEGSLSCPRFVRSGTTANEILKDVKYNAWHTYYFPAQQFLNPWNDTRDSANTGANRITICTSILEYCNLYIDRIYFANEAVITGDYTKTADSVTPNLACGNAKLDYTVYYNGELINLKNGAFKAPYAGDYEIYPIFLTGDVVHTGDPLICTVDAPASLQLNAYDKVIDASAPDGSFTLPQASLVNGDGYTLKTAIKFTNYLGKSSDVSSFDKTNKGIYEYTFTATKQGAKTLVATATVKSGARVNNEIFNFNDQDALDRTFIWTIGDKKILAEGDEGYPTGFSGTVLKLENDMAKHTTSPNKPANSMYFNFMPSATYDEIAENDFVRVTLAIKTKLAKGKVFPATTVTFSGTDYKFDEDGTIEIKIPTSDFLKQYHKMLLPIGNSTYEYIGRVQTTIASFTNFDIYVSGITMSKIVYAENEMFVVGNGVSLKGENSSGKATSGVEMSAGNTPAGFSGSVERINSTKTVSILSPLSVDQIIALKNSGYQTLNFSLYIQDTRDAGSVLFNDGLIYRHNGNNAMKLIQDQTWLNYEIPIDTVIAEMQESGTNELLLLQKRKVQDADLDSVYVSNVVFVK